MASRRKRRTCRDQRTIRQTTACRGEGWQAGGRGEHAEIRGQLDRLRHAEGEDGKQEEDRAIAEREDSWEITACRGERMASRRKRRDSSEERIFGRERHAEGRGWQAEERGEIAVKRGYLRENGMQRGEDGKQKEDNSPIG